MDFAATSAGKAEPCVSHPAIHVCILARRPKLVFFSIVLIYFFAYDALLHASPLRTRRSSRPCSLSQLGFHHPCSTSVFSFAALGWSERPSLLISVGSQWSGVLIVKDKFAGTPIWMIRTSRRKRSTQTQRSDTLVLTHEITANNPQTPALCDVCRRL